MTDLATIRIPVDSSDMVQAVRESKNLERGIKMLVEALDSGAIGSDQFGKGLGQLANEFKHLFTSSQQAGNSVQNFADNLQNYMAAAEQATAATRALSEASAKAETAFALGNQKAREELQILRNRAEFAFAMAQQKEREAKATAEAAKQNQQIINALSGVKTAYLSAEDSAEAFTQGLREQEAQALKTAKANQEAFNKQLGISGPSATDSGAGFGAIESEILRLETMYNKVALAARVYEQAQESLNRAVMMGVITADEQKAKLEEMALAYQRVGNSADAAQNFINTFGENAQVSGRGLNQFGMIAQQVGYQVGDFFVQVQSGTNVLVAFGQQATQLAGLIPGVWGAAIGIGISLATALGAAWMRTTEEVEKGADRQKQAYENLIETIERLRLERQMEASGVESSDEQIQLNEIVRLKKEQTDLQKQLNELGLQQSSKGFVEAKELRDQRQALQDQIDAKQIAIDILEAERVETERINRLNQVRINQVLEELAERERLKQAHADQVVLMGQAKAEQQQMTAAAQDALEKYGKMRSVAAGVASVDIEKGILAAAAAAANLARELGISLGLANRIMELGGEVVFDPRDPRYDPVVAEMMRLKEEAGTVSPFDPSRQETDTSSKSGGAGGNARIDSLINQLQTEREVVNEWYAESQETLMSASEAELAILGGYNEAKLRLEQEYQERLKGIRDEYNGTALGDAATFFGGMADIARAGGDKTVKAMRIFSAAQALINSYVAFTEVLKDPSFIGRPWARFGAAASALSSGLAAVASIKSGSGGSIGSGGGGRGSAVVSAAASDPTPQTVMIDSIDPDSLYSGQTLINLFDAFYNENDKRGKVFVVAR